MPRISLVQINEWSQQEEASASFSYPVTFPLFLQFSNSCSSGKIHLRFLFTAVSLNTWPGPNGITLDALSSWDNQSFLNHIPMSFTLICLCLLFVVVSVILAPFYNYSTISITCSPTYKFSNFSVLGLVYKMKNVHMVVQFFALSGLFKLHLFKRICVLLQYLKGQLT